MKRFLLFVLIMQVAISSSALAAKGGGGGTVNYKRAVIVDVNGGGNYTDVQSALNSITDNASNSRILVKVLPGLYEINEPIYSKPYVDIEGSGINITNIQASSSIWYSYGVVNINGNSEIRNLTIKNTNSNPLISTIVGIYCVEPANASIKNVEVDVVNSADGGSGWGIYVNDASAVIQGVNVNVQAQDHASGIRFFTYNMMVKNISISDSNINVNGGSALGLGFQSVNTDAELEASTISITNTNASAIASVGDGWGIFWSGGKIDTIAANLFSGSTFSLYEEYSLPSSGTTISDSTLVGPIYNPQSDLIFVNCFDGSGNPL
jgi:hypothetical protein